MNLEQGSGGATWEQAGPLDRAEVTEQLSAAQAYALAGLLDLTGTDQGDEAAAALDRGQLPPLWHWVHLLSRPASGDLGPDGHPRTGVPAPPGEGMRRMFAGGRVHTRRLLRLGEQATRRTWVTGTRVVDGRSGTLRIVSVRTEISQDGEVAVVEDNDIVYRRAGSPVTVPVGSLDAAPPQVEGPAVRVRADEALLMRFSALTYNAHRIHYDLGWCAVEGYEGLVVHGPLQALLMGELVRRCGAGLRTRVLDYRLVAPLVGTQSVTAALAPSDDGGPGSLERSVRVLDVHGRTTATATIHPAGAPADTDDPTEASR